MDHNETCRNPHQIDIKNASIPFGRKKIISPWAPNPSARLLHAPPCTSWWVLWRFDLGPKSLYFRLCRGPSKVQTIGVPATDTHIAYISPMSGAGPPDNGEPQSTMAEWFFCPLSVPMPVICSIAQVREALECLQSKISDKKEIDGIRYFQTRLWEKNIQTYS